MEVSQSSVTLVPIATQRDAFTSELGICSRPDMMAGRLLARALKPESDSRLSWRSDLAMFGEAIQSETVRQIVEKLGTAEDQSGKPTKPQKEDDNDNDNDNDNDTLKEVPHPSNEGLALQARVSGPWSHKKESVLLVELARWQGVQTQTVNGQSAMQQVLR